MKYALINPPPRNERYVICDVCGFKFHRKDTIEVNDIYNRHYGLIVCKSDYDKTNAQDRPFSVDENILTATEYVRDRSTDTFVTNENDDRAPGKPTSGICYPNTLYSYIDLYWDAPGDNGSSPIIGYIVQRASPQQGAYTALSDNTETSAAYYSDTTANISSEYSFKVAAINSFGIGPYSDEFFWPTFIGIWHDISYLVASQDNSVLTTSDTGYGIRVNHTEAGIV